MTPTGLADYKTVAASCGTRLLISARFLRNFKRGPLGKKVPDKLPKEAVIKLELEP